MLEVIIVVSDTYWKVLLQLLTPALGVNIMANVTITATDTNNQIKLPNELQRNNEKGPFFYAEQAVRVAPSQWLEYDYTNMFLTLPAGC